MTLTTYNEELCKKLEPNVCTTKERFDVLARLRDAGIPTVVWLCLILPFINDTEENVAGSLNYCIEAKVRRIICFGVGMTLRQGNREYFYSRLDELFPGIKEKYIRLYGTQYILNSPNSPSLTDLFQRTCTRHGITYDSKKIFEYLNTFADKRTAKQLGLFG